MGHACGPDNRIKPRGERPGGELMATMVSVECTAGNPNGQTLMTKS